MTDVSLYGFDGTTSSSTNYVREQVRLLGWKPTRGSQLCIIREDASSIRRALAESPKGAVRVLLAGELHGINFDLFDFVLGWEPWELSPRYARIHPALRETETLSTKPVGVTKVPIEDREFCNFIYSNPNAHPFRDEFFLELSNLQRVDSLGLHLNNVRQASFGQVENWVAEKIEMQSRYKFSIAIENGYYSGYTTEKIFTALKAGSIPLFWGNPDFHLDVNPDAIVSLDLFDTARAASEFIMELSEDETKLRGKASQPIFLPEHEEVIRRSAAQIHEVLNLASELAAHKANLRPVGTSPDLREAQYLQLLEFRKRRYLVRDAARSLHNRVRSLRSSLF